jgi:hypothetical protein
MHQLGIASRISAMTTILAITACVSQEAPKATSGPRQAIVINCEPAW